jgi:hypothetical protein
MSLRSFLTKERSPNRTLFVACGIGFVAYSAWHLWRANWGVACYLGVFGVLSLAAGALLSEQHLNTLAIALPLMNVIAAAAALATGVLIQ